MKTKLILLSSAVIGSFALQSCMLHTVSGVVTDASMNTITVRTPKEEHYRFSTMEAEKEAPHGIVIDDKAKVRYRGDYKPDEVNMAERVKVTPSKERKKEIKQQQAPQKPDNQQPQAQPQSQTQPQPGKSGQSQPIDASGRKVVQ